MVADRLVHGDCSIDRLCRAECELLAKVLHPDAGAKWETAPALGRQA